MSGPRFTGPAAEVPERLSYSQVSKYAECGERYRLEYGRGIRGHSWYATVAGKVIHEITEKQDLLALGGQVQVPLFEEAFRRQVQKEHDRGVTLKASGKKLEALSWTGGPGKKDMEWWLHYGPMFAPLYQRWRNSSQWQIATVTDPVTGELRFAIELEFKIRLGDEDIIGYIDRVFWDPESDTYIILDIKTGNLPESKLQLGDYAIGLFETYGIQATWGCYWSVYQPKPVSRSTEEEVLDDDGLPAFWKSGPRKGTPKTKKVTITEPSDLDSAISNPVSFGMFTKDRMEARYAMGRAGIMAGVFLPNVTALCRGCGVRKWCYAVGGDRASTLPTREDFVFLREPKPEEELVEESVEVDLTSA